jgi:CheY-like chemotaxis protein
MSKISRWFKDFGRRWGRGAFASKGLPSLVRVMDDLVPRKVMREVVASSHDRRQWGVLAAAWVGVSEREFHAAAAKAMGIALEERVVAPDLAPLGIGGRALLSELRRFGAMVVVEGRSISRIVAVDPAEVRGLSFYAPHIPVSLASWTEIARALDEAERSVVESERNGEHRESKKRQEICGKILDIIVREARAHGARSVEVITADSATRYQFRTSSGKTATGSIRPEVVQDLLRYLCTLDGSVIKNTECGDIVLRSLGSASNFRLSWGTPDAVTHEVASVIHAPYESLVRPGRESAASEASPRSMPSPAIAPISEAYFAESSKGEDLVLVVDDNPMFCRVLERLLQREGVQPSFAENGVLALEKLMTVRNVLPKVIICDLHMPVMNGRELLARLKGDELLKEIPVIMLTSDEDIDAELQLLAGGADAFVSKAKDPRVLTAQVRRLLKRQALQEAA